MKLFAYPFLFLSFYFIQSQVTIDKEPRWIVKEDYDQATALPENGVNGGTQMLLYTEQVHIDMEEVYIKSVSKAVEYSGIQNISSVVAEYDPSYQKLRFHHIDVIRKGKTINRLSYPDIQTARRETNAENFIYDGTISAFVNVPDVRIGDIVMFSYSIKGFNPIQRKKFSSSFVLNSTQPIDRISAHVFGSKELTYQILNSDLEAVHTKVNGVHHYTWADENVAAIIIEENTPVWNLQNATVVVSEYDSWTEVIDWGNAIFTFKEPVSKEIEDVAKDIKDKYSKEGDRIKAALGFVQNEVRYLALHSGIGGYKPNSPNKVMEQRYGDCKDKSVLFTALLHTMDIEAYPTLVNTSLRQKLPTLLPSSKVFDHCIVKVIDQRGTTLWFDPTLTDQGGTFDNTFIPDYRYGLVLDEKLGHLDTIFNFQNNMVETFNTFKLRKMGKGAELEVESHYHDGEADFMRSVFRNNSKNLIEKELLSFYTETYGSVSSITSPIFVDDSLKNEFVLHEQYQLDSIWKPSPENPSNQNLSIIPTNLTSVLSMPTQLNRSSPYALAYPMVRKQNIKVVLSESIQARPESFTINSDFFYYDYNSKYDRSSNIITIDFYYKNQSDHVPVSEFNTFYKDMVQLDQNIGYLITTGKSSGTLNTVGFTLGSIVGLILVVLLIVAILVGVIILIVKRRSILEG